MTKQHSETPLATESPMTVPMFLAFINANGQVVSREWFYRRLKAGDLPHFRLGKKILVLPSQIFSAMQQNHFGE
jgi:hypothetical protein